MKTIVELNNISKSYEKKVLNNVSIKINEGERVAIIGESGVGKSTLLNIIGLLENPDSGDFIINGHKNINVNSFKANKIIREEIGYIFQNYVLIEEYSVYENLEMALKYVKVSKEEKMNRIKNILKEVNLEGYEGKKIFELSGGEQQRIAIARVMLKPNIIILADEPTGALDEDNKYKVMELLKKLNKTTIIATHDKEVASQCDRIIELKRS